MSTPTASSPPATTPLPPSTTTNAKRRISSGLVNISSQSSTPGITTPSLKKSKSNPPPPSAPNHSGTSTPIPSLSRKSSLANTPGVVSSTAATKHAHPLRQTSFPADGPALAVVPPSVKRRQRSGSVASNATNGGVYTRGNSLDRVLVPPPASSGPSGGKDDSTAPGAGSGGGGGKGGAGGEGDEEGSEDEAGEEMETIMRVGDMQESEEQKEELQRRLNILMDHFNPDQMARYEAYRRGALHKSAVKKVANLVLGQSISANVAAAIGGFTKIYAGEMVQRALKVQKEWGDNKPGMPLMPEHIREAARRWRLEEGKTAADHVAALNSLNRRRVVGGMGGRLFK